MEWKIFFKKDKQAEFLLIIKHCVVKPKMRLYASLFPISAQYIKEEIGMA